MPLIRNQVNSERYRVEAPDVAVAQIVEPWIVNPPIRVQVPTVTPCQPTTEQANGPVCKTEVAGSVTPVGFQIAK